MPNEKVYFESIDFGDGIPRYPRGSGTGSISSVSVNGVQQTVSEGAVDLNIVDNLITEAQWTQIQAIL